MSGRFKVSLDDLAHTVDRMASFDRSAADVLTRIDARVAALAATWTGDAALAYVDAHTRWRNDLATMQQIVRGLQTVAATAHSNYTAAVDANRRMWT